MNLFFYDKLNIWPFIIVRKKRSPLKQCPLSKEMIISKYAALREIGKKTSFYSKSKANYYKHPEALRGENTWPQEHRKII